MDSNPLESPKNRPPRILGLDFGNRRIGVSVSDELGLTAHPVLTLVRKNLRQDLRSLARLARKYECAEIVMGEPLYPSGDPSPQGARVRDFAGQLEAETGMPVYLWDERLSTAEAHRYLDETGRRPKERKAVIDQLAAVLILQSFLDARRVPERPPSG
ncbi:MAG TPA: Holliday junction resolvase RuvX [Acidobacteriaceae bacterium]|jgi:putative Holliday junction resolvase|nr:Holliday junction resolvase RuvX [Acidobacteriaceae bacterium]